MPKNKVVYTCITGAYDDIPEHKYIDETWEYILFSDVESLIEQGKVQHWQVKKLEFKDLDNSRNSRYPKINPHLVLPEYKYSFYVDGNVIINDKAVYDRLEELIVSDVSIAICLHPQRNCLYQEAEAVKSLLIDYPYLVDQTMEIIKKDGYPKDNGLFENNLIFRQHNKAEIVAAQELWWKMLKKYSKRDQLSSLYCFWKFGVEITPFYQEQGRHRNCPEISFTHKKSHNRGVLTKYRLLPEWLIGLICLPILNKNSRAKVKSKLRSLTKVPMDKIRDKIKG